MRKPPMKVVVFQWPCGMLARNLSPLGARPRIRAMLVEAQVSSMNTRRSGSRSSCPSNQSSRRFKISARFCSAACAVFFKRQSAAVEERPERRAGGCHAAVSGQTLKQFADCQVRRLLNQPKQKLSVRVQFASRRLSLPVGRSFTRFPSAAHPYDRRRHADAKMGGGTPSRLARKRGIDNAITQILAVGPGHETPPSQSREKNRILRPGWESLLNRKTSNPL